MSNPPLLICDSDALFQVFLSGEIRLLESLRTGYGVSPVIVSEVELELLSSKKFHRFREGIKKSISKGAVQIFDDSALISHLGGSLAAAAGINRQIQVLGASFARRVGKGEAYTFATALTLKVPALSNDFSAIKTLSGQGCDLPSPILRFFDLVVFSYQNGRMPIGRCNAIRSSMMEAGEYIPSVFKNKSVEDGLVGFAARLLDSAKNPVGSSSQASTGGFDACLHLSAI